MKVPGENSKGQQFQSLTKGPERACSSEGKMTRTYFVADLFCGAGGSSTGARRAIEKAGGTMRLVAVNHWNTAIATHSTNHPDATHVVENVSIVDPEAVVESGYLDILMASPECTYHSRARGGKPTHDQGRMNPWAVMNWLTKLDVQHVLIENVPEFVDWGPLNPVTRKPIKAKRGEHFQSWFLNFFLLGYHAEWRVLNAADYGDATTRTRFFLLARKDGHPIQWPEPTHAKGNTGMFPGRRRWRGAREIIDWTNPGRSLLDDPKYTKKPLSEKTRRRIARGLERFGGPLAPLYIRLLDLPEHQVDGVEGRLNPGFIVNRHGENGAARVHSVDEPMPTATCRGAGYLVQPEAQPFVQANRNNNAPKGVHEPVPTVTTAHGGGSFLLAPGLHPFVPAHRRDTEPQSTEEPAPTVNARGPGSVESGAEAFLLGQQSGGAPRWAKDPVPTITSDGAISLVQASIIEYYGDFRAKDVDEPMSIITHRIEQPLVNPYIVRFNGKSTAADADAPLSTVTAGGKKHGLVNPVLVEYYGNSNAAIDVERPLPTVTTKDRHGLVNPVLVEVNHGNGSHGGKREDGRVRSVEDPLGTLTAKRGTGLANPVLVKTSQTHGNGLHAYPVDYPVPTLTTKADVVLATPVADPVIVPNFGEAEGQSSRCHSIDEPMPTVTSRGAGSLVSPQIERALLEQLERTEIDPRRVVFVDGVPHLLDIRFRMLQNPELARAMGFDDEESTYEFVGNVGEVTRQIGNAVPVHVASALVKTILGTRSMRAMQGKDSAAVVGTATSMPPQSGVAPTG